MLTIMIAAALTAQAPARAPDWWLVGDGGTAPARRLPFVDRQSITREGELASARVALAFEQPVSDVRLFEVTFEFQCDRRHQRARNAVYTLTDGSVVPDDGDLGDWGPTQSNGEAHLLAAICSDELPAGSRPIRRRPLEEAAETFSQQ